MDQKSSKTALFQQFLVQKFKIYPALIYSAACSSSSENDEEDADMKNKSGATKETAASSSSSSTKKRKKLSLTPEEEMALAMHSKVRKVEEPATNPLIGIKMKILTTREAEENTIVKKEIAVSSTGYENKNKNIYSTDMVLTTKDRNSLELPKIVFERPSSQTLDFWKKVAPGYRPPDVKKLRTTNAAGEFVFKDCVGGNDNNSNSHFCTDVKKTKKNQKNEFFFGPWDKKIFFLKI